MQNKEEILAQQRRYYYSNKEKVHKRQSHYAHNRYINGKRNKVNIRIRNGYSYWVYDTKQPVHVVIAEKILRRKLKKGEIVHHINGDSLNNHHSNLLICSRSYHNWLHKTKIIQEKINYKIPKVRLVEVE